MQDKKIKLNLIENAKDSLFHAVEHLTRTKNPSGNDLKHAILDTSHVVELILKERIRKIHPAFMWEDIDRYPSHDARTIGTEKAAARLLKLEGIALSDDLIKTLLGCRRIRNSIEHFEFEIDFKKARAIIGRVLSFIFYFSKRYLNLDLEADFKENKKWSALIDIYEFWEAHSKTLEKQLLEEGIDVCDCPSCNAMTFNLDVMECILCGHIENKLECERCHDIVWESNIETIREIDADESGVYPFEFMICKKCLEKEINEEIASESAVNMLKDD